jgi:hypothetical protein
MIFKLKIGISLSLITTLCFCKTSNYSEMKIAQIDSLTDSIYKVGFPIKGISFVGTNKVIDNFDILQVKEINANWVSLMPFAYNPDGNENSPQLSYNNSFQWWGETDKGIIATSKLAKNKNIKVLLKPQLWLGGNYTGSFTLETEADWKVWENCYSNYIFHFAHLADSLQLEMFCIGTELKLTIQNRPKYWNSLIDSIKTFYEGELIYAANWDDYQEVPFWKKLDYIGIDAYFPLSNSTTPTVEDLCKAWKIKKVEIEVFQKLINKPIIFTEIGYKSVDKCASEPWNPTAKNINLDAQQNSMEAFFKSFKNTPWFDGCFIWKWYPENKNSGGIKDDDYTPQNKPAVDVIRKYFKYQLN